MGGGGGGRCEGGLESGENRKCLLAAEFDAAVCSRVSGKGRINTLVANADLDSSVVKFKVRRPRRDERGWRRFTSGRDHRDLSQEKLCVSEFINRI